jgi:hypothetical protein
MKPSPNISKWALLRWAEVVLLVALFSGVLILINVIAYENSKRFDLTPGKRYSLLRSQCRFSMRSPMT